MVHSRLIDLLSNSVGHQVSLSRAFLLSTSGWCASATMQAEPLCVCVSLVTISQLGFDDLNEGRGETAFDRSLQLSQCERLNACPPPGMSHTLCQCLLSPLPALFLLRLCSVLSAVSGSRMIILGKLNIVLLSSLSSSGPAVLAYIL